MRSPSVFSLGTAVMPSAPWTPVASLPEPYDLLLLRFADGAVVRGTWTGKIWWGYDQRVRRSRALEPEAWQPWG